MEAASHSYKGYSGNEYPLLRDADRQMNKLAIYLVGLLLAIALWYGPGQAIIYSFVLSRADNVAYQVFEKDPKGWAAPKEKIDEHYKRGEDQAGIFSVLGAVIFGFGCGVGTTAIVRRWSARKTIVESEAEKTRN